MIDDVWSMQHMLPSSMRHPVNADQLEAHPTNCHDLANNLKDPNATIYPPKP